MLKIIKQIYLIIKILFMLAIVWVVIMFGVGIAILGVMLGTQTFDFNPNPSLATNIANYFVAGIIMALCFMPLLQILRAIYDGFREAFKGKFSKTIIPDK